MYEDFDPDGPPEPGDRGRLFALLHGPDQAKVVVVPVGNAGSMRQS